MVYNGRIFRIKIQCQLYSFYKSIIRRKNNNKKKRILNPHKHFSIFILGKNLVIWQHCLLQSTAESKQLFVYVSLSLFALFCCIFLLIRSACLMSFVIPSVIWIYYSRKKLWLVLTFYCPKCAVMSVMNVHGLNWFPNIPDKFVTWGQDISLYEVRSKGETDVKSKWKLCSCAC